MANGDSEICLLFAIARVLDERGKTKIPNLHIHVGIQKNVAKF